MSKEAVEGKFDFSGQKKLEYRFASDPIGNAEDASPVFLSPASMVVEYSFTLPPGLRPALEAGDASWILPGAEDLGGGSHNGIIHYAIPVDDFFPQEFSIALTGGLSGKAADKSPHYGLNIRSVEFGERWFGFDNRMDALSEHWYVSPFVSHWPGAASSAWVIDLPEAFGAPAGFFPVVSATLLPVKNPLPGNAVFIDAGVRRFEVPPYLDRLIIPAGLIAPDVQPLNLISDTITSFYLVYAQPPPFPEPITADPGMALAWPVENWRDRRYEVFRWEQFPSLLIFDFADYAVQDRMLKRLAFFVEKAGYRGRLARDGEIADLHGWNAHDYRAEDLARFFQLARETNFPLLAEERELEQILLDTGIIRRSGADMQGGEGGIISVSRESPDYLRSRFMAHEGFHGLFFIDEDFRAFSRDRWRQFPADAKRFIVSFFGYQQYDTADEYLLVNEFMAHILQQPVSQAGFYFGQNLPSRLEDSWRRAHLPEKDAASNSWPSLAIAFTREAEAFSAYVYNRWGLAAGRVHLVNVY